MRVAAVNKPLRRPEHVLKYLARYTYRAAISNGRLLSCEQGCVRFRCRNSRQGNRRQVVALDGVEFLRRFSLHVLPKGFIRIRYFGLLAARNLSHCRQLLAAASTVPIPNYSATNNNAPSNADAPAATRDGCASSNGSPPPSCLSFNLTRRPSRLSIPHERHPAFLGSRRLARPSCLRGPIPAPSNPLFPVRQSRVRSDSRRNTANPPCRGLDPLSEVLARIRSP